MCFFHYAVQFRIDWVTDKEYEPMAYAALSDFSKMKKKLVDDIGCITQEEKNKILREVLGYSKTKVSKIVENFIKHNIIEIDADDRIWIKEFEPQKGIQYFGLTRDTIQYFYDTFGKESLILRAYIFLGSKWKMHENLGIFPQGFCFTLGGTSKMSLLRSLGYKSSGQSTKQRLIDGLDILQEEGIVDIMGPHVITFGNAIKVNNVYTLSYLKVIQNKRPKDFFFEIPEDILSRHIEEKNENNLGPHREVTTERFAPYLPKFRNYYVDQDSPQYDFVHNLSALGEDTVLVLYHDMGDENLIKLLRDFPQQMGMDPGKIMFSTLSNQDDDVDDIWSVEPYD